MDEEIYRDMIAKGLISVGDWLRRAIEQHHPRLTVSLAYSEPLQFDALDAVLGTKDDFYQSEISEN